MSQNRLEIPNGSGLSVRVGFNEALQAIVSGYAGPTDPVTMSPNNAYPYMVWPDTANNLLKQRTADNAAWVPIGVINVDGTFSFYADFIKTIASGNLASLNQAAVNAELDSRGYGDNLFLNPFFQIWQRGTSFALAVGASAYTSDRKLVTNNTNQSVTITQFQYANKQYSLRATPTTTAPTTGTVDVIERSDKHELSRKIGVGCLEGQYATVQFEVDGADPTFSFRQFFGTGGSPSASVDTAVILTKTSLGGTANKYVGSVAVPSISGKTIGTTTDTDYLQSTLSIPLRSTAVNIMAMQCQIGKVNSIFRQRDNELSLCHRYYETGVWVGFRSPGVSGETILIKSEFKQIKRTNPTVGTYIGYITSGASIRTGKLEVSNSYSIWGYGLCNTSGTFDGSGSFTADAEFPI